MKAFRFIAVLALSALTLTACSSTNEAGAPSSAQTRTDYKDGQVATVKSVESGNTVTVDIDGKSEQVRLLNVVAPSEHNNSPSGTCLLQESTDFLSSKLPQGQQVTLNFDDAQVGTSGFLDAAVLVGEDLVNSEVVREGLAATTYATPNDEFYSQISKAQQKAAEEGKGIYSKDVECSIPSKIQKRIDEVKDAKNLAEASRKPVFLSASSYYNELVRAQGAPASYLGSIVTLTAVKDQLEGLRTALGDNYYDESGSSVADKNSASANASDRPK